MAVDADSPRIQELLKLNKLWVDGLDWSALQGWLIATHKDVIVGAVQVLFGKPLGVIAYLVVDPAYHNSGVGYPLIKAAEALLKINGTDAMTGFTDRPEMQKILKRYKCTPVGEFTTYIKRIYRGKKEETDAIL